MAQNYTKCPVCFTKMNSNGHDLVCPECGYKYCEGRTPYTYDEHNHSQYQSYNTKTTYTTSNTGTATTYTSSSSQARPTYSTSQTSSNTQSTAQTSYQNAMAQRAQMTQNAANRPRQKSKGARFVVILFVCYFFIIVGAAIVGMIRGFIGNEANVEDIYNYFFNSEAEQTSESGQKRSKESTQEPEESQQPALQSQRVGENFDTVSEYLAYIQTLDAPQTFVQELIFESSGKTDMSELSETDISAITEIFSQDYYGSMHVYYALSDQTRDMYDGLALPFDTSEFKFLTNLEIARTWNETSPVIYQEGDLKGLPLLMYLSCGNTPEEIVNIVEDPAQLQILMLINTDTKLDLAGLSQFSNLTYLDIQVSGLSHFEEIGTLNYLRDLSMLAPNGVEDLSCLANCKRLNWLELETPYLKSIDFLSELPELETFRFIRNNYVEDISVLISCTAITDIYLDSPLSVNDFTPIAQMTQLQRLDLFNCGLTDISWITSLTNLEDAAFAYNMLTDVSPLGKLPNLTSVELRGNNVQNFGDLNKSLIWDIEDLE